MGTIVLPPQDCLSSLHSPQNSFFSSARSEIGRKCLQSVMVPLPASQDCARHNHSGGSPPGDGLLPIPLFGQARVLSKKLPPSTSTSTSTSTFCTPPLQRTSPGSPPPRMKPKLSRSASAILPTPLAGSPPLAEGLLKGRLPFKVVQGNGPGKNNDCVQGNVSKKLNNLRNSVRKKITTTTNHMPNVKDNGNSDKSISTPADGVGLRRQTKDDDARTRKVLARSSSGKGEIADAPAVMILQRPKTEEAAVELFEKFFQKSAFKGVDGMSEKSKNLHKMIKESEPENEFAVEELSNCDGSDVSSCKTLSTPSSKCKTETKSMTEVKTLDLADVGGIDTQFELGALDGDVSHGSKAFVLETACQELATWERWAGPSYINSPPPSALPLPRFSKKNLKIVMLDNFHVEHLEDVAPDQISTPPSSSISPLYTSLGRQRHLNINMDAIATATKDLKRILNLDLCGM